MRVIIAGSRNLKDYQLVEDAVRRSGFEISTILSGHAPGCDRLGEEYAKRHDIPCELWPAYWGVYGNRAGFIRNRDMAQNAEALIAVWDGVSPGTKRMLSIARRMGLKVYLLKAGRATQEELFL